MAEIKHHFFGKECFIDRQLSNYANLEENLRKLSFNYQYPPLFLNQIHSNQAVLINSADKIYDKNNQPKADALITNIKNLPLAIITADCVPILLYDSSNSVIATIHAGWKGAKKGIIGETIAQMLKIGAKAENIVCLIGPAIRQNSYEVSAEFYQEFIEENSSNQKFFINSQKPNHFMFDLPAYVKEKLQNERLKKIMDLGID